MPRFRCRFFATRGARVAAAAVGIGGLGDTIRIEQSSPFSFYNSAKIRDAPFRKIPAQNQRRASRCRQRPRRCQRTRRQRSRRRRRFHPRRDLRQNPRPRRLRLDAQPRRLPRRRLFRNRKKARFRIFVGRHRALRKCQNAGICRRRRKRRPVGFRRARRGRNLARLSQCLPPSRLAVVHARRKNRRQIHPLPLPRLGLRDQRRMQRNAAFHPARQRQIAQDILHRPLARVRSRRVRIAAGRRRRMGRLRFRQRRQRRAAARRMRGRFADAPRRPPPRRVDLRRAKRIRNRRQLETPRRKRHRVLPFAVGASAPRQNLARPRPRPLARRRNVLRHSDPPADFDRRFGLAANAADGRACRRRFNQRLFFRAVSESHLFCDAESCVRDSRPPARARQNRRDRVADDASENRRPNQAQNRRRGAGFLGSSQSRGCRHRLARPARAFESRLSGRADVLSLRRAGASIPESRRRRDAGRAADSPRRRAKRRRFFGLRAPRFRRARAAAAARKPRRAAPRRNK